tara:strand:+ start:1019 stop:1432 length:414 start_codon:yes stop_codon:yes gene_type:complete
MDTNEKIKQIQKKFDDKKLGYLTTPLRALARYLYNKDLEKSKQREIREIFAKVDDYDGMNKDAKVSFRTGIRSTLEEVMQNVRDSGEKIVKSQKIDKSYPDLKKRKDLSVDKKGKFKFASGGKVYSKNQPRKISYVD